MSGPFVMIGLRFATPFFRYDGTMPGVIYYGIKSLKFFKEHYSYDEVYICDDIKKGLFAFVR